MDAAASMTGLRAWWRSLSSTPAPLDGRQKTAFWLLALLVAATRPLAVAKSLWDWDEALFTLALRDYDVTQHHPHPPGFPLFIATARVIMLFAGTSEFRALQAVAVVASILVFPAMYFLARELRASHFVAAASAALLAFLPNVWFFGGTAFSDVPSMTLAAAACGLLLRGGRSSASAAGGLVVLAIAVGYRPQNLLICFVPAAIVLLRRPRVALLGGVFAVLIVVASYGAAAFLSGGWDAYNSALAQHERYIRGTDSFLAPMRPSLAKVSDDFLYRPFRVPFLNLALAILAAVGLLRRRAHALVAVSIFGPFVLFAWLMLDFHSSSRFSIAYMPLWALLAAEGAAILPRVRSAVVALLVVAVAWWMVEPLATVRNTLSPPVAAAEWIRRAHPGAAVVVDARMVPLAEALLPGHDLVRDPATVRGETVVLREDVSDERGAVHFVRPRAKLARVLTRPRYFEVSVVPLPVRPATVR